MGARPRLRIPLLSGVTAALVGGALCGPAVWRPLSGLELKAIQSRALGAGSLLEQTLGWPVRWLEQHLGTNAFHERLPSLLLAGVGLWLLWMAMCRTSGAAGAAAGTLLWVLMPAAGRCWYAGPGAGAVLVGGIGCGAGLAALRTKERTRMVAAGCCAAALLSMFALTERPGWSLVGSFGLALAGASATSRMPQRWMRAGTLGVLGIAVVAAGALDLRESRLQRRALRAFVNTVERATAPGEQVLIGDPLAAEVLKWNGSAQLVAGVSEFSPVASMSSVPEGACIPRGGCVAAMQESILVDRVDGRLAQAEREHGARLLILPDPPGIERLCTRDGRKALALRGTQVMIVTHPWDANHDPRH